MENHPGRARQRGGAGAISWPAEASPGLIQPPLTGATDPTGALLVQVYRTLLAALLTNDGMQAALAGGEGGLVSFTVSPSSPAPGLGEAPDSGLKLAGPGTSGRERFNPNHLHFICSWPLLQTLPEKQCNLFPSFICQCIIYSMLKTVVAPGQAPTMAPNHYHSASH